MPDALQFGNEHTDTTLQAAIGSDHWTLNISRGTWKIDKDLTFHSNTQLKFEEGAIFDIDGAKVRINGVVDAGLYQIFDIDANSILNLYCAENLQVQWVGAVDDSSCGFGANNHNAIDICNTVCQWNESNTGIKNCYLQFMLDSANNAKYSLNFQTGNKFFYFSDHEGGEFHLKDCRIENYNKDYSFIYRDYYNMSTFEIYIKHRVYRHKTNFIPFQKLTHKPGILIIEGDTYIKFFNIY